MLTEAELEYLDSQRIGRLATSQPDGTLQNNPVGFGVNRQLGTIDIGGYNMARSRKFRNVAENDETFWWVAMTHDAALEDDVAARRRSASDLQVFIAESTFARGEW